ncbi:MAG: type II toxin-antitoxin system HipA family toxin, partial [Victivallales bacterium]|nr:type II toxin-antitoxin system HipA family toxin [Victivallales bacterium]
DFSLADLTACEEAVSMKRGRAKRILAEVRSVVSHWRDYADEARVSPTQRDQIQNALRLAPWAGQ